MIKHRHIFHNRKWSFVPHYKIYLMDRATDVQRLPQLDLGAVTSMDTAKEPERSE